MPTTLKDVASAAGVSWQVVATVLKGSGSARASVETAQRIRRLAEEMNYRPHAAARTLVTGKSRNIELHEYRYDVIHNQVSAHHLPLLSALSQYCRLRRYNLLLVAGADIRLEDRMRGLHEQNVDAMVHLAITDTTLLDAAHKAGIPNLCVSPTLPPAELEAAGFPVLTFDNASGIRQVFEHLLGLGHVHFGFAQADSFHSDFQERWQLFRQMLREHGLPEREEWRWRAIPTIEGGAEIGAQIASAESLPTALICANDALALGILHAVQESGMRVPEQISITGYDDVESTKVVSPSLTTVRQDWNKLSWEAVKQIFNMLEPEVERAVEIDLRCRVELIKRDSTGPARAQKNKRMPIDKNANL